MPIYRRGEIWHIKITHQGRVVRRSTHTSDRTQAQRQHDEIKADLWESGQGLDPLLSEVLMHWLTVRLRTVNERNCCSAFLNLYPDRRVSQITAEGIRTALASKSNGTTNRYLSVVCASLRLAERSGLCLLKPNTIPQKRSSPPGRTTFLSQAQWLRLQKVLSPHLLSMARLAVATGLRYSNIRDLAWQQVDLDRGILWIHADQAKAGKLIQVPLSPAAVEVLRGEAGKHHEYVFTYRGKPIVGSVKTAWNRSVKAAGIPNLRWHDLRHTWASWHVQAGTPLPVLQKLGGWASLDMVMRYAHLTPDFTAAYAANWEKAQKKAQKESSQT